MPLPLSVLKATVQRQIMVELKNGETLSGILVKCDGFMNLSLKDLVRTSRDGDQFWKMTECYVRGNNVKYFRLQDDILDLAMEQSLAQESAQGGGAGQSNKRRHDWDQPLQARGRGRKIAAVQPLNEKGGSRGQKRKK